VDRLSALPTHLPIPLSFSVVTQNRIYIYKERDEEGNEIIITKWQEVHKTFKSNNSVYE